MEYQLCALFGGDEFAYVLNDKNIPARKKRQILNLCIIAGKKPRVKIANDALEIHSAEWSGDYVIFNGAKKLRYSDFPKAKFFVG